MMGKTYIYRFLSILLLCFVQAAGIIVCGQELSRAASKRAHVVTKDSARIGRPLVVASSDSLANVQGEAAIADSISEENYRHLQEFRVDNPQEYKVGDKIELSVLDNVEKVDVTGKSIGKGFQGTVKRWNFGRGPMGHGSKNHREPGSIGAGTTPSRVIKGKRMAGNMGNERVTITKLKLVKVDADKKLVLVKGSVPGCEGRLVTIVPTRTKWN